MLEWFVKSNIINYLILVSSILGFISIVVVGSSYSKLVKHSYKIASTNSKLLKKIRLKYINCYKLKLYTNEVKSFIDRYLYKEKKFRIPIYIWENIQMEMIYTSIILGFLGSFINIIYYQKNYIYPLTNAFEVGILGFASAAVLIIIRMAFAVEAKKRVFYSNVTDYLENMLKNKLNQQVIVEGDYEKDKKNKEKNKDFEKDKEEHTTNIHTNNISDENIRNVLQFQQQKEGDRESSISENFIEDIINQVMG